MSPITPAFSAADANLDTVTGLLDGAPFASGAPVTAEGDHVLEVTATDLATNVSVETINFTIDDTPPAIAISGFTDGQVTALDVTPVVSFSDVNLVSTSLTLDGAPFVSGTVVTAEGTHTLVAEATDCAGNTTIETRTFTVDRTPPVITIVGVFDGQITNHDVTPIVTFTDDNLDTTSLSLNAAPFVSGTTITVEADYSLVAEATDLGDCGACPPPPPPGCSADAYEPNDTSSANVAMSDGQTICSLSICGGDWDWATSSSACRFGTDAPVDFATVSTASSYEPRTVASATRLRTPCE